MSVTRIEIIDEINDGLLYNVRQMGFRLPLLGAPIDLGDTPAVVCLPEFPKTNPYGSLLGVEAKIEGDRLIKVGTWFFGTVSNELLDVKKAGDADLTDDFVIDALVASMHNRAYGSVVDVLKLLFEICPKISSTYY